MGVPNEIPGAHTIVHRKVTKSLDTVEVWGSSPHEPTIVFTYASGRSHPCVRPLSRRGIFYLAHDRPIHTDPLAPGCLDFLCVDSKRLRQGHGSRCAVPECLLSSHLCRRTVQGVQRREEG